ncbi:radical SAM protein [Marinisporobacter balticus]|uniref:Organic radical activating enzyme n=1 Tax=Marinisporobacter balticus TaxID=2018667 RepID=A0A4R2KYM9_9FIRM|nr:radical SAM protein [Marinisporobacter balticus]TCO76456.1 organic radical activating enzyme [Marinisporobacter balticus]
MNKKDELNLLRSGIVITLRCTLKCKLCGGYAPYYAIPPHFSYEEIKETVQNYFSIINYVEDFSITGGEPLLHKDLDKILKSVIEYSDQIGRILILTNGTIEFSDDVINVIKSNKKCHVTISDYGKLSSKVDHIVNELEKNNISYRVIEYSGNNTFCDGWVDYGDHKKKHFTQEEIDEKARKCAIRNRKVSIVINGELHSCGRSMRRMELGIIPKNPNEYVDLNDKKVSIEEKRLRINRMYESVSTTSCAYCNGLCEDSERFPSAEQL